MPKQVRHEMMQLSRRRREWAFGTLVVLLTAGCSPIESGDSIGELTIERAWTRATAEGATVGVGYFVIANHGQEDDSLIGASTPVAELAEFHRTEHRDGMVRMRPATEVVIAAGTVVKAEPDGLHLMLMGLKQPLRVGKSVTLDLTFRKAGTVTVHMEVRSLLDTHER